MNNENNKLFEDEIDLRTLFQIVWKKKFLILSISSIAAIFSIFYALSLPNIYTSSSLLAPTSEEDSLSSQLGRYSGLAGLAGVQLQGNSSSKSEEAIKRIKSFSFFYEYFLTNVKLENLMALEDWIQKGNKLIYDDDQFDSESGKWVRKVSFPQTTIPSAQEAFIKYKSILNIKKEADTGFVAISVDHMSPIVAKKWVDIIIYNINESMRELDKVKAVNSIAFLNESAKSTNIQSIREVIANLQETQMQTLMLASSNKEYIFKIIDSAIVPERKSAPNRAFICILGTIFGGILSLLIVFMQVYRESSKT